MKTILVVALCLIASSVQADNIRVLARDYELSDTVIKPVSFGILSWTDRAGTGIGAYGSICGMTFADARLELGVAASVDKRLEIAPLTGVGFPIDDTLTVGVWYAPFWNLYNSAHSDDPWGVMVGYRF